MQQLCISVVCLSEEDCCHSLITPLTLGNSAMLISFGHEVEPLGARLRARRGKFVRQVRDL